MGKALPMGRTRPPDRPWLTVEDGTGWRWRVLKAYSADPDAPYARWLCEVDSPHTQGIPDMGDTYTADLYGYIVQIDPEVPDEALPRRIRHNRARSLRRVGPVVIVEV